MPLVHVFRLAVRKFVCFMPRKSLQQFIFENNSLNLVESWITQIVQRHYYYVIKFDLKRTRFILFNPFGTKKNLKNLIFEIPKVAISKGYNKGSFLLSPYIVLNYDFEQVILFILNLHLLVQQFINHYIFSSIKKKNWLINKGMRLFYLMFSMDVLQQRNKQAEECQTFTIMKN